MPNRKQLLQDFYAKYAPDQELSDERLEAINNKYKGDDRAMLNDLYAKYTPDQELTEERYNAIVNKYQLKKKEATSQGSPTPSKPSAPSGNEVKVKELTVKATQLAAAGDQQGLAKIRQEIINLKNQGRDLPLYEKSPGEDASRPKAKPLNVDFTEEQMKGAGSVRNTPVPKPEQQTFEQFKQQQTATPETEEQKKVLGMVESMAKSQSEVQKQVAERKKKEYGDYLGIKDVSKFDLEGLELQYKESIQTAKNMLSAFPESAQPLSLNEALKRREEISMMPVNTEEENRARLRAIAESDKDLERSYQELEGRAMEYWKTYDPGKYEVYSSRLATIRDKVGDIPLYDFDWQEKSGFLQSFGDMFQEVSPAAGSVFKGIVGLDMQQNLSTEEKKFLEDFRIEALQLQQNADNYRIKKIGENYDFKSYSSDAALVKSKMDETLKQIKSIEGDYKLEENKILSQHNSFSAKAKSAMAKVSAMEKSLESYVTADGQLKDPSKQDEYNQKYDEYQAAVQDYNKITESLPPIYDDSGRIIAPASTPKMKALYDQYNTYREQYNELGEKYGITPEVQQEYFGAIGNLEKADAALAFARKYKELENNRAVAAYFQQEKARIMQDGSLFEKGAAIAKDVATGFGQAIIPIAEAPKFISDVSGSSEQYGWTDALADISQDMQTKIGDRTTYGPLEVPEWMKQVQDLSQGVGSALSFAATGGLAGAAGKAIGIPQKAIGAYQKSTVFSQVFLGSINDNYRTAKLAGLSNEEAILASTAQSFGDSIGETIVPDYKLFSAASRTNLFSAVKNLGFKDGIKEWAPQYAADLAENFIKEGVEETVSELSSKAASGTINFLTDTKVYDSTIKSSDLLNVFTTGGGVGLIMEAFRIGSPYKHPITKSATRWYSELSESERENIKMNSDIQQVNELNEIEKNTEAITIARDMNMLPEYAFMNEAEKDNLFSLLMERRQIPKTYKGLGLSGSDVEKAEIDKLDQQIKQQFIDVQTRREQEITGEIAKQREDMQEFGVALRVPEVKQAEDVMSKGEFLDDKVLAKADEGLSRMIDEVIEREDLSDDEKVQLAQVLEDKRQKLNSYEYRSENEVITSTQSRPSGIVEKARAANERAEKPIAAAAAKQNPIPVALDGVKGKVKVSDSTMVDNMGETIPEGYYVFIPDSDTGQGGRMGAVVIGSIEDVDSSSTFEGVENNPSWSPDNNIVANFTTPDGQTLSILDDDLSADVGVKQKEDVIGAAPQALFDVVFDEVTTELGIKEKPYLKDDTKNQEGLPSSQRAGQTPVEAGPVQGAGTEEVAPSGVVQEQEVDFDGAPKLTTEESQAMAAEYDNATSQVLEFDDTLSPEDADLATSFVQMGATPQEAVQMVRDEKESISMASEPVTQEIKEESAPQEEAGGEGRNLSLSTPFEYTKSRAIQLKEKAANNPILKRALRNLDKAAEAFSKTFGSKVPVYVFDTQRQMAEALDQAGVVIDEGTNGTILFNNDGTILGIFMNTESQDFTVGSHEFVHAALSQFFEDNPEMFNKWRESVLRNFQGSDIKRLKEWAEREYDKDSSAEEFITQLTAELADTNKQLALPKSFINSIKDLFNSVWESVTGSPLFSERATDKDVVAFINDMAKGLSTGQAISTKAAERLADSEKKSKRKPKVSRSVVAQRSKVALGQINQINAATALAKSIDDRIVAEQVKSEAFADNPDLEFIMDNFDKIEKVLVKEGKLKVNCEL